MTRWTIRETGYLVGMASGVPLAFAAAILFGWALGSAPMTALQLGLAAALVAVFAVMACLSKWMMDH